MRTSFRKIHQFAGKGDLDECNGINASITLNTAQGSETYYYYYYYYYYYVVTPSFPQIPRCMKGNFSGDFANNSPALSGVDSDGFISSFDCNDNDASINPFAIDNPNTTFDESCGAVLSTVSKTLEELGYYVSDNPNDGNFSVISTNSGIYEVTVYSLSGRLTRTKQGLGVINFENIKSSGLYVLSITKDNRLLGTLKIIVK